MNKTLSLIGLGFILGACGGPAETDLPEEGSEVGDCSDGIDNDEDGVSDCDDFGCAESVDCEGTDTGEADTCLLYTSPSPRDATLSRMPSSA